jgi:uncharacterized membrane protein YeaQ/YmgE (transglycosylase-associated protein family)
MSIIGTIIAGLIIGLLARAIKPGNDSMGWIFTILLGIGGALLGGWLAVALGIGAGGIVTQLIVGVIGAIILLVIAEFIRKQMNKA